MMTKPTMNMIEEALRKEVQKIDKSVQVVAVEQGKKKSFYRQVGQRGPAKGFNRGTSFRKRHRQAIKKGAGQSSQPFEHQVRQITPRRFRPFRRPVAWP